MTVAFLFIVQTTYADPPPFFLPDYDIVNIHSDSTSVTIPFTRVGNLILIRAKADTTEGSFILDTGAPGLVLNISYFRHCAISMESGGGGGITGEVDGCMHTTIEELSFAGVRYDKVEADLIDLGHIESRKNVRILGLLGMRLFERFEVIIDYQKSELHLHLIRHKEQDGYQNDMLADTSAYSVLPIDIIEDKIIAHVTICNKKLKFLIDCGAETNVLDSRLPAKILDNVSISKRVLLGGTGNAQTEALYGTMNNVSIGTQQVNNMPVLITNLEKMCYSYNYCIDGMLGFDYLSLHKIGFNFVKRKMYIWK